MPHPPRLLPGHRGRFGSLIVEDDLAPQVVKTVFTHLWPGAGDPIAAFDTADNPTALAIDPGKPVLLRLINSSEEPHRLHLGGTPYTVTAVDGDAIRGAAPPPMGTDLLLAAGGRFDVVFTMPRGAVAMSIDVDEIPNTAAPAFSPDGSAVPAKLGTGPLFDPLAYGTAPPVEKVAHDRAYEIVLDDGFGFAQGSFTYVSSSMTATGSTWWTDAQRRARRDLRDRLHREQPGIWMDHCHNFEHGAESMIMHLAYTGITSPFDETHIPE
ncbi:hypothetical protein [Nonomuraea dietziae]|uniref:hypothetical protein n=1 Tax=Nonomuraea dietziae TaxID=65515 RepID=UPI003424B893